MLAALALAEEPWERDGLGWGALPALNYNSDEGFGFGALGSIYRYDGRSRPYAWSVSALIFTTTKGIHTHRVGVDVPSLAGGRLRLTARVQLDVTRTDNYCGVGGDVSCDPAEAAAAADGLTGEEREAFLSRYYRLRWIRPYAIVNARYKLRDLPHKVEVLGGARVAVHRPGDLSESGPFPGSLYAKDQPDGEPGVVSVLQGGVVIDDRDNEPSPTRGYWAEASLRGAAPYWGSTWSYFGFNATFRGYVPIVPDRLVLASRTVVDGLVGDVPTLDLASMGGTQIYSGYGGADAGRGIRLRRYRGRVKAFEQAELRFLAVGIEKPVPLDVWLLGFGEVGHVAGDWSELGRGDVLLGTGGGLRLAFDDNFVIRADVGVSPVEGWSPSVYIDIDNLF